MVFAKFDDEGFPIGFYTEEIHGDTIPAGSIEISEAQWKDFLDNAGLRRWENGGIVEIEPPAPPETSPTIIDYENAIQNLVDETAREKQFRDGVTLASYIGSTKPKWAAEAQAFVAWRDNVWFYAYGELDKVQAGHRPQPTVEQFLDEIARIAWPVA
ncbi:hypothetical protein N5K21_27860 [Rhizobium pusense]|uniref:hypothetical protein n=1 Tax=Rhizobium/Agrobacterium group TaxID=227290 RepID=UPI001A0BE061|nr:MULTISPECIES: hypothetical protein [Rhizobium/Agrobacterium group]MDH2092534.1 hypothetical protein [Agrobacterium pusense]CAD7058275.1 hypothetical protein RP007_05807 [Rhizobium sp. P007]